jgi:hypothetical protein
VSPPSAGISGTEHCAAPARSPGRDRVPAVRKKRQTPGPAPNLQRDSNGQCPCELRQVGRDGVLAVRRILGTEDCAPPTRSHGRDGVSAVRNNAGHRGLCPSRRAFAGPIFSIAGDGDSPGRLELPHERARGTVPLPGIARSKAPQPICKVGRDGVSAVRNNAGHRGLCPSRKVPCKGPRPRGQQEHRAQRTAPLPGHRQTEGVLGGWPISGETVCLRCAFGGRGGVCASRAGWPGLGGDRACG